jgi:hypothetical protein
MCPAINDGPFAARQCGIVPAPHTRFCPCELPAPCRPRRPPRGISREGLRFVLPHCSTQQHPGLGAAQRPLWLRHLETARTISMRYVAPLTQFSPAALMLCSRRSPLESSPGLDVAPLSSCTSLTTVHGWIPRRHHLRWTAGHGGPLPLSPSPLLFLLALLSTSSCSHCRHLPTCCHLKVCCSLHPPILTHRLLLGPLAPPRPALPRPSSRPLRSPRCGPSPMQRPPLLVPFVLSVQQTPVARGLRRLPMHAASPQHRLPAPCHQPHLVAHSSPAHMRTTARKAVSRWTCPARTAPRPQSPRPWGRGWRP